MQNYYWKGFKTKEDAESFKSTKGLSAQIFNVKKEKERLELEGYSDCLAVYQRLDKSCEWAVEWISM